jgi:hypothetical protein
MMRPSHRGLAACVIVWLGCQLGVLVVTPSALCAGATAEATVCTCAHGPGQVCPMHHKMGPPPKGTCACRSTGDDGSVALLAGLLLPTAMPPAAIGTRVPPLWQPRVAFASPSPATWLSGPHAPPPRG